jgi:hypothetical protein
MDANSSDLFELINEWAVALPNCHENSSKPASDTFSKLGNEIKQRLNELNQPTLGNCEYHDTDQGRNIVVKKEEGTEKEVDLKPPFVFELKSDSTASDQAFECVYDFCTALETFCQSTLASSLRLDIEKDWHKLLLACSSHNYERFMWIHLTFQSTLRLKLRWKQVVTRLMFKFDTPKRRILVEELLSSFRYIPELGTLTTNSIHMVNSDFCRYADEFGDDPAKIINYYVNGMPASIKQVIKSTMQYDEASHFKYTLLDIQQRATVFAMIKEDKFIFYSKSAHLAISLEHEKVNNKDCEFHLLAEHSTSNCPDYVIVKYPYMDFMPLVVTAAMNGNDVTMKSSSSPPKSNAEEVTANTVANSHPVDETKSIVLEPSHYPFPSTSSEDNQQKPVSMQSIASLPVNPTLNVQRSQSSVQTPIMTEAPQITERVNQDQVQQAPLKEASLEIMQTITTQKTSESQVTHHAQSTLTALQLHTTDTPLIQKTGASGNPPLPHAHDIADAMLRIQALAEAQSEAQSQVHTSFSQAKAAELTQSLITASVGQSPQRLQATTSTTVSTAEGVQAKPTSTPLFHSQAPTDPRLQILTGARALQSSSAVHTETSKTPAKFTPSKFQLLMTMTPEQRIQSLYPDLNDVQKASLFENLKTGADPSPTAASTAIGQIPTGPRALMNPLKRKKPYEESPASTVHHPITTSTGLPVGSSSYSGRSPSPTPKLPGRQRRRSPSPPSRYDRYQRSASPRSSHSRSPSPEEVGCYIHGVNASHTTKNCRKAQLVIQSRSSYSNLADTEGFRRPKGCSKKDEPNVCIFCGLIFKPGHLGFCKKVPSRKKGRRN